MITEAEFKKIDTAVKEAINTALDLVRDNYLPNYVLFLADGEYKAKYKNNKQGFSPYVIDNREDYYMDETRLKFVVDFLKTFYRFLPPENRVDDSEIRQHMEFMIYSHIWEAKPFLKKLYRLARVVDGNPYDWNAHVPPMGKHKFILNQTRDVFNKKVTSLANIISNGFHTTLRNAFAHSEYSFDNTNKRVWLDSYTGSFPGDIQDISYNDWSTRFAYSVLLNYHLLNICNERRARIIKEFGTNTFEIDHPSGNRIIKRPIIYREEHDSFGFK